MLRMAALGYQRTSKKSGLRMEDMWPLEEENTTAGIMKYFTPKYEAEVKKKKNRPTKAVREDGTKVYADQQNIMYPLLKTFGWPLLGVAFIKFVASVLTFVNPMVLNLLIIFVQSNGKWHSS